MQSTSRHVQLNSYWVFLIALSLLLMFAGTTGLVVGCEQLRLAKEQHARVEAAHVNGANGASSVAVERREYAPANPR